jgi:hypothetical protein
MYNKTYNQTILKRQDLNKIKLSANVRLKQVVADPLHFDADPNPSFQIDSDPDPVPYKVIRICDHWSPKNLHGFILSLYASTTSVYGPPLP